MAAWILYVAIGRADAIELASKWSTAKAVRYHAESRIDGFEVSGDLGVALA